jgi:hypothetical protein
LKTLVVDLDLLNQVQVVTPYSVLLDLKERAVTESSSDIVFLQSDVSSHNSEFDLLNSGVVDYQLISELLSKGITDFSIDFDVLFTQLKTLVVDLDLLNQVQVVTPYSVLFNIREQVVKSFGSDLDFLITVTGDKNIVATLLNAVTMDFINTFDLNSQVVSEHVISLDYVGRVGKSFDVVFSLQEEVAPLPLHYVVTLGGSITFTKGETTILDFLENDNEIIIV